MPRRLADFVTDVNTDISRAMISGRDTCIGKTYSKDLITPTIMRIMIIAHNFCLESREKEFHEDDEAALISLATLAILFLHKCYEYLKAKNVACVDKGLD